MDDCKIEDISVEPVKTRKDYVAELKAGMVVAFKNSEKMLKGKVMDILNEGLENEMVLIQTKNLSVFEATRDDVVWIKTGTHWPQGIYNALKYNMR